MKEIHRARYRKEVWEKGTELLGSVSATHCQHLHMLTHLEAPCTAVNWQTHKMLPHHQTLNQRFPIYPIMFRDVTPMSAFLMPWFQSSLIM